MRWCRSDKNSGEMVGWLKGQLSKPGDRALASCLDSLYGEDGEEHDMHIRAQRSSVQTSASVLSSLGRIEIGHR